MAIKHKDNTPEPAEPVIPPPAPHTPASPSATEAAMDQLAGFYDPPAPTKRYRIGCYPDGPMEYYTIGGIGLSHRRTNPHTQASELGETVALTDAQLERLRTAAVEQVVRVAEVHDAEEDITRYRLIPVSAVAKGEDGRPRYRRQRLDHPVGCYLWVVPENEFHGELPPRLYALPDHVAPVVAEAKRQRDLAMRKTTHREPAPPVVMAPV